MTLGDLRVCRKGEKELLKSEQLAKLLGRVKTDDWFVNASDGEENLEEPDDRFVIENIVSALEETPARLEKLESGLDKLGPVLEQLTKQLALHLEVEQQQLTTQQAQEVTQGEISKGISELRGAVSDLKKPGDTLPSRPSKSHLDVDFKPRYSENQEKHGLERYIDQEKLEIELVRDTPPFGYDDQGAERLVRALPEGSRIFLPFKVAKKIIQDGYAREILEGDTMKL